ncbi:hypothetical protein LCGC14_0388380 [marine sediment metagenome]|uniref:Uncharacterized protein n=1 Tax=marine sediment metagenome TaxID=412755 RepID=A0A0F9VMB7_9ZZZZ
MFNRHKTKWIQLGNYSYAGCDYVVFVRGDKKTGLLDFKTKKIQNWVYGSYSILSTDLIDVKKQWEEITNLIK